jgi:hypothetical protein
MAGERVERVDLDEGHVRTELAEFLADVDRWRRGPRPRRRGGPLGCAGRSPRAADRPSRGAVARVAERAGVDRDEAERRVRTHDGARQAYLRRAFGITTHDRSLYHLVVDTIALGIDASVELVLTASRARTQLSPKES